MMDKKFTFITGAPRSGTSYLVMLMAEHPDATHIKGDMVGVERADFSVESGMFFALGMEEAFNTLNSLAPGHYIEKTPLHGYFIKDILAELPTAKVIFTVRNPINVCASYVKADWITGGDKLKEIIFHYKKLSEVVLSVRDERLMLVEFEDFVKYPYSVLKDCYKFAELRALPDNAIENIVEKHKEGKHLGPGVYDGNPDPSDVLSEKQISVVRKETFHYYHKLLKKYEEESRSGS